MGEKSSPLTANRIYYWAPGRMTSRVTPWSWRPSCTWLIKKKSLNNHFPVTLPQTDRGRWTQSSQPQWCESRPQLFRWASYYQHNALPLQRQSAARLTRLSLKNCDICSQTVFVFLSPFTMVQFSWQPELACCFFLERGGVWFFWQCRLPSHLIVSLSCGAHWPRDRAAAAVPGEPQWGQGYTTARSLVLTAGATTASTGPQWQDPAPWSHCRWTTSIHRFCWHSGGRRLAQLMSYSRWLSQKHCKRTK